MADAIHREQAWAIDPARRVRRLAVIIPDPFARIDFAMIAPFLAQRVRPEHQQQVVEVIGFFARPLGAIRNNVEEWPMLTLLHGLPVFGGSALDDRECHGCSPLIFNGFLLCCAFLAISRLRSGLSLAARAFPPCAARWERQ